MLRAIVAVLLAFLVTALAILMAGKSPLAAYGAPLRGAFGSLDHVAFALNKSTPYILIAVGIALCFRAGLINIGGEGQVAMEALAASWVALHIGGSHVLTILLSLAGGVAMGGLWAAIAAALRLTRGVHEVLSTLLLNFVGVLIVSAALKGPMGETPASRSIFSRSASLFHGRAPVMRIDLFTALPIPPLSQLPVVGPILFQQPILTYGAVLLAIALHVFLYRTNAGLVVRATGENPEAVYAAGHDPVRIRQLAVIACGAIAGLGGAVLVLQAVGTFTDGMTGGRGFLALAALIVGRWNPFGVLLACLVFGAASALEVRVQGAGLPASSYVVQMLPYVIALLVLAGLGRRTRRPQAIGRVSNGLTVARKEIQGLKIGVHKFRWRP